jgi:serine/threonine-protein kinase HipA
MMALVLMVPDALERVEAQLPTTFPRVVFNAIRRGMLAQAERFVAEA